MLVEPVNEVALDLLAIHFLSQPVPVELGGPTTEDVWLGLEVVLLKVAEDFRRHVCVVGAWTDRREEVRAGLLVRGAGNDPARKNDACEVAEEKEPALAAVLDLD